MTSNPFISVTFHHIMKLCRPPYLYGFHSFILGGTPVKNPDLVEIGDVGQIDRILVSNNYLEREREDV